MLTLLDSNIYTGSEFIQIVYINVDTYLTCIGKSLIKDSTTVSLYFLYLYFVLNYINVLNNVVKEGHRLSKVF